VRTFPIKASAPAVPPPVTPTTTFSAVIQSVLPNPAGDDTQLEEVTLRNAGTTSLNLSGWTLKDRSGLTWTLTGTLTAGQSLTVRRHGQPMTLNNAGDEITLLDSANAERDRFSYTTSSQGQRIQTNH
jgi:hypothetical protein